MAEGPGTIAARRDGGPGAKASGAWVRRGGATLVLARPTWASWRLGMAIAVIGEIVRVWAAGHLEKSREVTRSGPYRWTSHPLYLGLLDPRAWCDRRGEERRDRRAGHALYGATIGAAIRTEEAFLRRTFGAPYDDYKRSAAEPVPRGFSLARVRRNREYRAMLGLAVGFGLLALKIVLPV